MTSETKLADTYIYALCDPDNLAVRYIGKANNPQRRLQRHCWHMQPERETHNSRWVASLISQGKRPILKVLEKCSDNWREREHYWVGYYRDIGADLTNITEGGNGAPISIGLDIREKISRAGKGARHTEEAKRRISKSRTGIKFTDEHKSKLSQSKKDYFARVENTFNLSRFWAKLTDEQAIEIYRLANSGEYTHKKLSEIYGVAQSTISEIKCKKRYKHALAEVG